MKNLQKNIFVISIGMMLIGLLAGYFIFGRQSFSIEHVHDLTEVNGVWTCSMHPQVRQNEPGSCPICGMDLIPLESGDENLDPLAISMSATAMQLANIQTAIIGSNGLAKSLKLSGKVQEDERLKFTQTTHMAGRIERLTVNFTGEYINAGQVIAYIYSPELATAQQELLQAWKIKDSQPALFEASKEKLKNWKVSEEQINQILSDGQVVEQFPIRSNISGYVTQKLVSLGDYVSKGQSIYEVSDLSKVWVLLDIYESELTWIKTGDQVEYTVQSIPGESFTGKISFIDPFIDPKTRVAKARIEVSNPKLSLKPEMFVSGTITSDVNSDISSISIPKSAVLWTGKRSIVYVKTSAENGISFKLREVTLGPALGDSYLIEKGLENGEEIAVNGTFSIDAASQLAGKPSMMSPEGNSTSVGHQHGNMSTNNAKVSLEVPISTEAKNSLKPIYLSYFKVKDALTSDDLELAKTNAQEMEKDLKSVKMSLFKGNSHELWMNFQGSLLRSLKGAIKAGDIEFFRKDFQSLSKEMLAMTEQFQAYSGKLYVQHCPMADSNKGADWLSLDSNIVNPYFGKAMLSCGEVTKTFE